MTCHICNGTGRHLSTVPLGRGHQTWSVFCRCETGQAQREENAARLRAKRGAA